MNFDLGIVYVELDVDDEYERDIYGSLFMVIDVEIFFIDFDLFLIEYILIIYGYCLSVDRFLEIIILEWIVEECVDFIVLIGV